MFELRRDKRRASRNGKRSFDPLHLNERHQEILNLSILGIKGSDIAKALEVSEVTVNNAINSTLGKQKMAVMRGARDADTIDVAKRMQEIIPKALEVYEKILSDEVDVKGQAHGGASILIQKQVADKVLENYSGLVVPKKVMIGHAQVTPELLRELKEQGKQAARECGLVIEGEVIE